MGTVTDYLADIADADRRAVLSRVIEVARGVVPDADEGMGYGMPALRHRGKPLIAVVSAAKHLSLFPFSSGVVEAVADDLDGFSVSKGTIRFDVAHPVPDAVVERIVRLRVDEIEGRA
jgi:uncharacterized protein YdhG (YjbR/CyaY superfamily)